MSKIQGKQIAEKTIQQGNLNLETPNSGDTTSGATVGYVESYITSLSGATVIGPAEDGTYNDGIFTDFTNNTRIGVAVDRFNEMFLLLSPSPPKSWDNTLSNLNFTNNKYSPRSLTIGTVVNNMVNTSTPTPTINSLVGVEEDARVREGVFTLIDDGSTLETTEITNSSVSKTTGRIRYTIQDPYDGISGKQGFWTGVTDFSLNETLPSITPSTNQRTMVLNHPGVDSPESFNYYIDNALTVSIGTITADVPTMNGNVSGVPTLTAGQSVTGITFDINNVASYFYAPTSVWQINQLLVNGQTGDPDNIPTTSGETGSVTDTSTTIRSGQFSDTSFYFTVRGRNSIGTYGGNTTFTSTSHRVDTVSSETSRLTSGEGSYPSVWGGTYDSSVSLLTAGNYSNELQLRNGVYVYPTINYTTQGGPNYSTATGTRYVTFNVGSFTNNSAFTLNITGTGINTIDQSNLRIEVKISGQTYWVDGDSAYAGVGNPGSSIDGTGAVVIGSSTATSRRITFGGITYTGPIIVRIGFTESGPSVTSLTATSIT